MARMKRGALVASILLLISIVVSACNQPYSQPPAVTNTPIDPNSLFATALTESDSMKDVENFSTQTAQAALTPNPGDVTATLAVVSETPTPLVALNPTVTATLASSGVATSGVVATSVPVGSRPGTYTLQPGEFPYCIARRFDVDPDQLLALSGLTGAQSNSLSTGTVLTIPQSGSFPGNRSWHGHPATFIVGSTYDTNTVYGVACYYGDVEPAVIAQNNNISVNATLTAGQSLNIP